MLAAHSWAALANAPVGIVASIKAAKAHSASGTAAALPNSFWVRSGHLSMRWPCPQFHRKRHEKQDRPEAAG
jgi:hypothetical protein